MRTPKILNAPGKKFWKSIVKDYDMTEPQDKERLLMACKCLDDIDKSEKQVEVDGHYVKDRYSQIKTHPALRDIKDNRIIFCRIIRELGLDVEPPESRPPKLRGY